MISDLKENKDAVLIYDILNHDESEIKCRFVGGCVRNALSGKEITDIDFATVLEPNQVEDKLKKKQINYDSTAKKYGCITIKLNNNKIEVTTLRRDYNQDGRHAEIVFTKDWKQDALRRDLSINAIYSDLEGNLIDPFHGVEHLESGKIVFIGDPKKKIKEDALRALRYFRFFSEFSKHEHDPYVLKAIQNNFDLIEKLSKERLIEELKKILLSNSIYKIFDHEFSKDFYLTLYKGIKYFSRFNFYKKNKNLNFSFDWVILLSIFLIDQTNNFEKFVKNFHLSNEVRNRLDQIQKQFTFRTTQAPDKIETILKKVPIFGKDAVIDFVKFQYLVCDNYKYELFQENLSKIANQKKPEFEFDANLLIQRGFKQDSRLGDAISFLKHRWVSNNYEIKDKDVEDAIKLYK